MAINLTNPDDIDLLRRRINQLSDMLTTLDTFLLRLKSGSWENEIGDSETLGALRLMALRNKIQTVLNNIKNATAGVDA